MNENDLEIKIITDAIISQQSTLSETKNDISILKERLAEAEARVRFLNKAINRYEEDLKSLGVSLTDVKYTGMPGPMTLSIAPARTGAPPPPGVAPPPPKNASSIDMPSKTDGVIFSVGQTLSFLAKNNRPNGLQVKHLVEFYQENGIKSHGRPVFRHLEELMSAGMVIQTNPGVQRGKRYRVIADS